MRRGLANDGQLDPRHPSGFSGSFGVAAGGITRSPSEASVRGWLGSTPIERRPRIGASGVRWGLAGNSQLDPSHPVAFLASKVCASRMPFSGVARSTPASAVRLDQGECASLASQLDPSHPWRAWIGGQCTGARWRKPARPSYPLVRLDHRLVRRGSLAIASSTPATLGVPALQASCARGLAGISQLDPSHPGGAGLATRTFLSIHFASSGQQLLDHAGRLDAGQALVEPLVAVSEPPMVEPQELQHGGVEVADVHGVLDDVV